MSPALDERDRVYAPLDRILGGTSEHSNAALAAEAQVPRNALTHRHTDLKNEFYDEDRARGQTTGRRTAVAWQIRRLKELRAADADKIAQHKADIDALSSAPLHQATVENQLLRQQLGQRAVIVHALPPQPQLPMVHGERNPPGR
ncbi:hypothetical protein [Streptomyces sp. NPDC058701]|uniref:hypothetical protein n=1 Tax=Streptomyces sp. NPDC058701 TaxID=3346608 RepID=UPI00366222D3